MFSFFNEVEIKKKQFIRLVLCLKWYKTKKIIYILKYNILDHCLLQFYDTLSNFKILKQESFISFALLGI